VIAIPAQPRREPVKLPEGTIVHRDLAYVTKGHERQKLDLYLPKDAKYAPLVVMIHGGAFRVGSKEGENPVPMLTEGYAVASINYRLSQHAIWPAQIEDCKAAVRWLRANAAKYGIDANRIASYGQSAGGHLASMLGVMSDVKQFDVGENLKYSSKVIAVADFFGPTDFLQMDAHRLPTGMVHDTGDSPESHLVGGAIQQNKDKVARANPITYVSKNDPPFLIVHGDQDPLVPRETFEEIRRA
jgi:acetyl esterase/lipase